MTRSKKARPDPALMPMLPHETIYIGIDVGLLKSPSLCQIQHLTPPARGFDGHLP
jgi:hypothetical protein